MDLLMNHDGPLEPPTPKLVTFNAYATIFIGGILADNEADAEEQVRRNLLADGFIPADVDIFLPNEDPDEEGDAERNGDFS